MGSLLSTETTQTITYSVPPGYAVVVVPFYSTLYTTRLVQTPYRCEISPPIGDVGKDGVPGGTPEKPGVCGNVGNECKEGIS